MRCDYVHDSAAYVLGALLPAERGRYERHLAMCPTCQADVSELAVLPGLLGRLDSATAETAGDQGPRNAGETGFRSQGSDLAPRIVPNHRPEPNAWGASAGGPPADPAPVPGGSASGLPALLAAAQRSRGRDRRRRRWQTTAAVLVAACAAVVVTLGAGVLARSPGPALAAMHSTGSAVPVSAEIALRPVGNRTQIRMHCHYAPVREPGSERYTVRLFAVPKGGGEGQQLSTWDASFGDDMSFVTTADVRLADVQRLELRKNDGTSVILAYDLT